MHMYTSSHVYLFACIPLRMYTYARVYLCTCIPMQRVFAQGGPQLSVASDARGACCQYYEPRHVAIEHGYPYPFQPRTHLYRDSFAGFASTVRGATQRAARRRLATEKHSKEMDDSMLHYCHDIVMGRDGAATLGGKPEPNGVLAQDLSSTLKALRPINQFQPFFGGFQNGKLWIGQKYSCTYA